MRCDQWIGLTDEAKAFLDEHCNMVPGTKCPHCGGLLNHKRDVKEYDEVEGMFGTPAGSLLEYNLKNGRVAKEVVQDVPWSSGPCFFICLEIDGVRCFEWPQEEIDNA